MIVKLVFVVVLAQFFIFISLGFFNVMLGIFGPRYWDFEKMRVEALGNLHQSVYVVASFVGLRLGFRVRVRVSSQASRVYPTWCAIHTARRGQPCV